MKINISRINGTGLGIGVFYSVLTSLFISSIPFIISLILFNNFDVNTVVGIIMGFFAFSLYAAIITLIISICIGIPVVIILALVKLEDEWISASIGAFIVFVTFLVSDGIKPYVFIFIFYGFCCAFSFMKGYKKA